MLGLRRMDMALQWHSIDCQMLVDYEDLPELWLDLALAFWAARGCVSGDAADDAGQ